MTDRPNLRDPNPLLSKAEADLARVRARLARHREDVRKGEAEEAQLVGVLAWLGKQEVPSIAPATSPLVDTVHAAPALAGSKTDALVSAAVEAIRAANRPLQIADLEAAVVRQGLVIGGKQPRANLAGYLSRSPLVEYTKDTGWRLCSPETEEAPNGASPAGASFVGEAKTFAGSSSSRLNS